MSSRAARTREKEDKVIALRLAGLGFDAIAKQVGYRDRSGAWKAYKKALERRTVPSEPGEEMREDEVNLDLLRLDELQSRIYAKAMRGDLSALDRVLKIMERRDRLQKRYHAARSTQGQPAPTGDVVVPKTKLDQLREKRRAGQ